MKNTLRIKLTRLVAAVSTLIVFGGVTAISTPTIATPVAAAVSQRAPLAQRLTKSGLHYVRLDAENSQVWTNGQQNYSYVNDYWFTAKHIVTVSVMKYPRANTAPANTKITHDALLTAIAKVNASGANIQLCYVGEGVNNADIHITYEDEAHPDELTGNIAGETTPLVYDHPEIPSNVHLRYFDPTKPQFVSANIDIHELGHSLGLGHTDGVTKEPTIMQTTGATDGNLDYYYQALRYLYGRKTSGSIAGTAHVAYNKHYGIQIWTKSGKPVRYNATEAQKFHHKPGDAKKLMGQTDWKIFANTYQANGTIYFNLGGNQYIDARYVTIK